MFFTLRHGRVESLEWPSGRHRFLMLQSIWHLVLSVIFFFVFFSSRQALSFTVGSNSCTRNVTGKHVRLGNICKSILGRGRRDDCGEEHFRWLTRLVLIEPESLAVFEAEIGYTDDSGKKKIKQYVFLYMRKKNTLETWVSRFSFLVT